MESQLSDILDNILGLLLLEGSYEIEEDDENFSVSIETSDAGRLIGARGESLDSLQLLVNQIMSKKIGGQAPEANGFKRVVLDVSGWRKTKIEDLEKRAKEWGLQVLETGTPMEIEPQTSWQRRVVHTVIGEIKGLSSESEGEGRDRHIVIKAGTNSPPSVEQKSKVKTGEDQDGKTAEA